jgi:hypothetical protein
MDSMIYTDAYDFIREHVGPDRMSRSDCAIVISLLCVTFDWDKDEICQKLAECLRENHEE